MIPIRLYSDFELFSGEAGMFPLLLPFAPRDRLPPPDGSVRGSRFDGLMRTVPQSFKLSSREQADLFVLATPWDVVRRNPRYLERAIELGKQAGNRALLIYDVSDVEDEIPIPNALTLRTSSRRSRKRDNEVIVPGWSEDLLAHHAPDALSRPVPSTVPTVSFCGLSEPLHDSLRLDAKALLLRSTDALGLRVGNYGNQVRRQVMRRLLRSSQVKASFDVKRSFFGGAQQRGVIDSDKAVAARLEFVQSIVASDYVLCIRGAGNYSFRFFETLCLGRVPVVVDTDSTFPHEDRIDPRSFCVWVSRSELSRIDSLIAAHFRRIHPRYSDELARLRKIWEKWYSPEGYFDALADNLRKRLEQGGSARRAI